MSLALWILFSMMLLLMLCRNKVSQVINEGLFCIKFLVLLLVFVATFFLPTLVLNFYAEVARISSLVFLSIQAVILVDLFYLYAINLVRKYDDGSDYCAGLLVGLTVIAEASAFLLVVLAFVNFGHDLCGSTSWLSIITLVSILILPLIQLLHFNPQNSLFTTALVSLLLSYYSFSAQEYFLTGCLVRLTPSGFAIDILISLLLFSISMYGTVMGGFSSNEYQDQT